MSTEAIIAIATAIGAVTGSVITGVGTVMVNVIKAKGQTEQEKNAAIITQQNEYTKSIKEDLLEAKKQIKELQTRLDDLVGQHNQCMREHERATARIEFLTELMRDKGMDVRPWNPQGSDVHTPLPSDLDRRKKDDRNYRGPDRRNKGDR